MESKSEYEKLKALIRKICGSKKCTWDCVECEMYHARRKAAKRAT